MSSLIDPFSYTLGTTVFPQGFPSLSIGRGVSIEVPQILTGYAGFCKYEFALEDYNDNRKTNVMRHDDNIKPLDVTMARSQPYSDAVIYAVEFFITLFKIRTDRFQ